MQHRNNKTSRRVSVKSRQINGVRTIHLECLHSLEMVSPPAIGELIYCFRCDDYKRVIKAPPQYRTRCNNCKKIRIDTFGAARITAEATMANHRKRHPDHSVSLYDGSLLIETWQPLSLTQPSLLDEPPF